MQYIWQLRNYLLFDRWYYQLIKWPFTFKQFLQKATLNAKVSNWGIELSDYNLKFKFIKGIRNMLANTLSRLINLELTESNLPEICYEYGYTMFEQLPDLYVDSSKHKPIPLVNVSNINATVMNQEKGEDIEIQFNSVWKIWLMHKVVTLSAPL